VGFNGGSRGGRCNVPFQQYDLLLGGGALRIHVDVDIQVRQLIFEARIFRYPVPNFLNDLLFIRVGTAAGAACD
jgi:hypothetical protein